jgi:hypothetical protein
VSCGEVGRVGGFEGGAEEREDGGAEGVAGVLEAGYQVLGGGEGEGEGL